MVSIIMPTYNRAYIIERAIQSVQRQTYKDWELIIVDDASTDYTQQLLEKYVDSKIHSYVKEKNQGANEARNFGAAHAKGEFLAFLDSDNYWPDDRLEVQMQMVEAYRNERCFFYGKVQITNEEEVITVPETIVASEELKEKELRSNVVDTNTLLISKKFFDEIGGFKKEIPRMQDWEIVLRALFCYHLEAVGSEKVLSFNYIQKNSISNDEAAAAKAYGIIMKNYLSRYLSPEEIVEILLGICYGTSSGLDSAGEVVLKMCKDNTMIASEIIYRLHGLCKQIQDEERIIEKKRRMEEMLYTWHEKNTKSKDSTIFLSYFQEKQIRTIAIYGLGKLGTLFYEEVKRLSITIKYGIDRKKEHFEDLRIKRPGDVLEKVDLMIIAVLDDAEEIKAGLKQNYKGEIAMLKELIFTI